MSASSDGMPSQPAGNFSAWLQDARATLRGERDSDVPCGTCTACCRASQFIHIAPEETATLSRIPAVAFLKDHAERFPPGFVPRNSTQLATLAVQAGPVFIDDDPVADRAARPIRDTVDAVVRACRLR